MFIFIPCRFYPEESYASVYRIGGLNVPSGRSKMFGEMIDLFHLLAVDKELVSCPPPILARVPNEILPDVLEK